MLSKVNLGPDGEELPPKEPGAKEEESSHDESSGDEKKKKDKKDKKDKRKDQQEKNDDSKDKKAKTKYAASVLTQRSVLSRITKEDVPTVHAGMSHLSAMVALIDEVHSELLHKGKSAPRSMADEVQACKDNLMQSRAQLMEKQNEKHVPLGALQDFLVSAAGRVRSAEGCIRRL